MMLGPHMYGVLTRDLSHQRDQLPALLLPLLGDCGEKVIDADGCWDGLVWLAAHASSRSDGSASALAQDIDSGRIRRILEGKSRAVDALVG